MNSASSFVSSDRQPKLTTVSPTTGRAYLNAAETYCLRHLSDIVPIFCDGCFPSLMVEFPQSHERRDLLARRGGTYTNAAGEVILVDQKADDYRAELIADIKSAYNLSDAEAIEKLFPASERKARDETRRDILKQSQSLIQCMNQLWPTVEIKLQMSNDPDIKRATKIVDLIAWTHAFNAFCLSNCGNQTFNIKAAEQALEDTKMKGMDVAGYIKAFKVAAENVKICNSKMTEDQIVATFLRNLNQSPDAFPRYDTRHLDNMDALHSLLLKPLQASIDHVASYHKNVIMPSLSIRRMAPKLAFPLAGKSPTSEAIDSHTLRAILTTLVKNNNIKSDGIGKNNYDNSNKSNNNKRKFEQSSKITNIPKPRQVTEVPVSKTIPGKDSIQKCYNFRDHGSCKFGDNCRFSHK